MQGIEVQRIARGGVFNVLALAVEAADGLLPLLADAVDKEMPAALDGEWCECHSVNGSLNVSHGSNHGVHGDFLAGIHIDCRLAVDVVPQH